VAFTNFCFEYMFIKLFFVYFGLAFTTSGPPGFPTNSPSTLYNNICISSWFALAFIAFGLCGLLSNCEITINIMHSPLQLRRFPICSYLFRCRRKSLNTFRWRASINNIPRYVQLPSSRSVVLTRLSQGTHEVRFRNPSPPPTLSAYRFHRFPYRHGTALVLWSSCSCSSPISK
jgi:hypothetical protein